MSEARLTYFLFAFGFSASLLSTSLVTGAEGEDASKGGYLAPSGERYQVYLQTSPETRGMRFDHFAGMLVDKEAYTKTAIVMQKSEMNALLRQMAGKKGYLHMHVTAEDGEAVSCTSYLDVPLPDPETAPSLAAEIQKRLKLQTPLTLTLGFEDHNDPNKNRVLVDAKEMKSGQPTKPQAKGDGGNTSQGRSHKKAQPEPEDGP